MTTRPTPNRRRRVMPVFTLVALLLLSACGTEAPPPTARAVRTIEIAPRSPLSAARYAGALEARERVDVSFEVGGRVASVALVGGRPLQEGDVVARGQILATLDDGDLRRLAAAAAAELAVARAQAEAARTARDQATLDVERARALSASGDVPKVQLEHAESGLAAAAAAERSARAQVEVRVERLALAQSAIADAALVSPLDGVVARRLLDPGESAAPGMAAFTVIDPSELHVAFAVPDTRVDALAMGMRLPVRVEALPDRAFVGAVVMIAPVADPALRAFSVEVAVDNADGSLRTGMVASVGVDGREAAPAVFVPLGAVVRDPGKSDGFAVYVVEGDSIAGLRSVEIADLVGNEAIVEDGLAEGEQVVVEGAALLYDGAPVEVVP